MAKEQTSVGENFLVSKLDRGYLGEDKPVMLVDGSSGDTSWKDEDGEEIMGIDFEEGIVRFSGTLQMTVVDDSDRPAATAVPAGSVVWNSDDNAPNYSDGTNWRDAMGNLT